MVNPFFDLGVDPVVAWLAAGWRATFPPPPARGFIYLRNGEAARSLDGDQLEVVRKVAAAATAESGDVIAIGEAKFLIGDRVIYQGIELLEPVATETLLAHAFETAEWLLSDVYKARPILNPGKPGDRAIIIRQLADAMVAEARPGELSAVKAGRQFLDADWPNLSKKESENLIRQAANRIKAVPVRAVPGIKKVISVEQKRVMEGARKAAIQRHRLDISPNLTSPDRASIRAAQETSATWLTNEYGYRAGKFERDARLIVENGLKQGLGRSEIAGDLGKQLRNAGLGRSENYYQVYAAALVDRSRTRAELNSYRDAEITRWIASAVMDEVTTDFCRWVDGRVFDVDSSIDIMDRAEKLDLDVDEMKAANPWVRMKQDEKGNLNATANNRPIFSVERSGVGTQSRGSYRDAAGADKLDALGVGPPPYHGKCRTTTVADVQIVVV